MEPLANICLFDLIEGEHVNTIKEIVRVDRFPVNGLADMVTYVYKALEEDYSTKVSDKIVERI